MVPLRAKVQQKFPVVCNSLCEVYLLLCVFLSYFLHNTYKCDSSGSLCIMHILWETNHSPAFCCHFILWLAFCSGFHLWDMVRIFWLIILLLKDFPFPAPFKSVSSPCRDAERMWNTSTGSHSFRHVLLIICLFCKAQNGIISNYIIVRLYKIIDSLFLQSTIKGHCGELWMPLHSYIGRHEQN